METSDNHLGKEVFFNAGVVLVVFLFGFLVLGSVWEICSSGDSFESNLFRYDLFAGSAGNAVEGAQRMVFVRENILVGTVPPVSANTQVLGVMSEGRGVGSENGQAIIEYVVGSGDSLSSIAKDFNVSLETVLWANNLKSSSVISLGQKLIIPPVSGVIYYVEKGDTLNEIAQAHKGEVEQIIDFNNLSGHGDIFVGDILIIPGGKMPKEKSSGYYSETPIGSSYFICPHSDCYITQGLHWYNAIDFGGKCGDPIYAAAAGVVQRVKYGWNGGAGNYVSILHPNGVVTMYGHVQKALVSQGEEVSQGDIIALMGGRPGTEGAGISTGCHVHFDVRGARNPFAR